MYRHDCRQRGCAQVTPCNVGVHQNALRGDIKKCRHPPESTHAQSCATTHMMYIANIPKPMAIRCVSCTTHSHTHLHCLGQSRQSTVHACSQHSAGGASCVVGKQSNWRAARQVRSGARLSREGECTRRQVELQGEAGTLPRPQMRGLKCVRDPKPKTVLVVTAMLAKPRPGPADQGGHPSPSAEGSPPAASGSPAAAGRSSAPSSGSGCSCSDPCCCGECGRAPPPAPGLAAPDLAAPSGCEAPSVIWLDPPFPPLLPPRLTAAWQERPTQHDFHAQIDGARAKGQTMHSQPI